MLIHVGDEVLLGAELVSQLVGSERLPVRALLRAPVGVQHVQMIFHRLYGNLRLSNDFKLSITNTHPNCAIKP